MRFHYPTLRNNPLRTIPRSHCQSEVNRCVVLRSAVHNTYTHSHFAFGIVNRPDLQNAHQRASTRIDFLQSEWGIREISLSYHQFVCFFVEFPTLSPSWFSVNENYSRRYSSQDRIAKSHWYKDITSIYTWIQVVEHTALQWLISTCVMLGFHRRV